MNKALLYRGFKAAAIKRWEKVTRTPAVSVLVCSITSIDATGNSWSAGLCRAYESEPDSEGGVL